MGKYKGENVGEKGDIKTLRDLIVRPKAHEMALLMIQPVSSFPQGQPFGL